MIELALLPQHLRLEPGGLIRTNITLHSVDGVAAEYTLEIHGLDGDWYTLSSARLNVSPAVDESAILTLHPPLDVPPGVHPFELIASRVDALEETTRTEGVLVIEELGMSEADAVSPAAIAASAFASGGQWHQVPAPASRRWALVGAIAAVLLLFAGAAYAYSRRHNGRNAATPVAPACTTASCQPTPTATDPVLALLNTPVPTASGAPSAGAGGTPPVAPTADSTVNPATGPAPGGGHTVPDGVFAGLPGSPNRPGAIGGIAGHPVLPASGTSPTRTPQTSGTSVATETPTATQPGASTATAIGTATAIDTATATSTRLPSATPVNTPTMPATATHVPSRTPTPIVPPTWTHTPVPTVTAVPSATPVPTQVLPATATPVPQATPGSSPTPLEVVVQYSYDVAADHFSLSWQSSNAVTFAIDDHPVALNGQQSFPLQTHTFVLTATGPDGAQSVHVVAFVVVGPCAVQVNSKRIAIPSTGCAGSGQPAASSTPVPTLRPADTNTPVPTTTPRPTQTSLPTATLFPTDTNTPLPSPTFG